MAGSPAWAAARSRHLPVDRLGRHGALVADEVGDVLERHPVGAEQRDGSVPELPRHPVGTQARENNDRIVPLIQPF